MLYKEQTKVIKEMIRKNDGTSLSEETQKTVNRIVEEISTRLEKEDIVHFYAYQRWNAEYFDRIVADKFKQADYFVAMDFVPHYRSLIVSKTRIPNPTGCLVSREFLN